MDRSPFVLSVNRDIKPENILVLPSSSYPNSQLSTSVGPHPAHPSSAPSGGISTVDNGPSPALPLPPPLVKLLDFGLSKLIDPKGGGSSAKTFVGTRAYLAPEVELLAHGEGRDYGRPADCWSLGAVLFVALVGKFPEFDVVRGVGDDGWGIHGLLLAASFGLVVVHTTWCL